MRDSLDSKGGTLGEMSYREERELVKPTSSRKTGQQQEVWGCNSTVKHSDPELFLSERTAGTKTEKSLKCSQKKGAYHDHTPEDSTSS